MIPAALLCRLTDDNRNSDKGPPHRWQMTAGILIKGRLHRCQMTAGILIKGRLHRCQMTL